MTTGSRYLSAPRRGRRRIGALGLGVLAAMSLVWQQQATLASFLDTELTRATFTAATLSAITPTITTTAATATGTWTAASGNWATPSYRFNWSPTGTGSGTNLYTGAATTATHTDSSGTPSSQATSFTGVAAGATHACGISRGKVFCWGSNGNGQLGLGHTVATVAVPTEVTGGAIAGKVVTAVTAGTNFTCALAEGRAYCWGLGTNGQLGDGGQSSSSTARLVSNLTGVTGISAGTAHACAVAAGKAYCWGLGDNGRIGDGGTSRKESPTEVKSDGVLAGRRVAAVSAGGSHSCAVADGRAYCWGLNGDGQLGDNSVVQRLTPVAVDASGELMGRAVSGISAGTAHSCAIADGKAFCWGLGTLGRLGNSATTTAQTPVVVNTSTMSGTVTALSAGFAHSCAVASGKAYCWGAGASYGLGNNATGNQTTPVATNGTLNGQEVVTLSAGTSFGCAVADGRPAACWGLGGSYQLGDNATANNPTPADVTLNGLACPDGSVRTSSTTCSLLQGTEYQYRLGYSIGTWNAPDSAWVKATTATRSGLAPALDARTDNSISLKWNEAPEPGQAYPEYTLQRSTSADHDDPVTLAVSGARTFTDVGGLAPTRNFTRVTTGEAHSCGIVGTEVYCWGQNQYGQLGTGNTTAASVPVKVTGLDGKTVTAVSAGQAHTCAIADDKVYCWGRGDSGQLGNGASQTQTAPVLVRNQDGITSTGVSAGGSHTCAIANGAAFCWGLNTNGQLGNGGTSTSNVPVAVSTSGEMGTRTVVSIAAGGAHSCAVANNNRAYCWGYNNSSQLGSRYCVFDIFGICFSYDNRDRPTSVAVESSGDMSTSTTSITAGSAHTCAIAANKAYCWGRGDSGQLGAGASPTSTRTPQTVTTTTMTGAVSQVSAGTSHTCAIAADKAYCWGLNGASQLGNGGTTTVNAPVAVTANGALKGAEVSSVAAGSTHGCLVAGGAAYCWGAGDNGRLGSRTSTTQTTPVAVLADARCASGSVSLGDGTCSLRAGVRYHYRVTFTLDGNTTTRGAWTDFTTTG